MIRRQFFIWFFTVLLWLPTNLSGQTYTADIQRFSVEDGLSNRFVTRVFQDSQGFIWVGTQHGLNRFDGYEFKTFSVEEGGLAANRINDIFEDQYERLWISYFANEEISILDLNTLRIQSLSNVFPTVVFPELEEKHMAADGDGGLLISAQAGQINHFKNGEVKKIFDAKHDTTEMFYADGESIWLNLWRKGLVHINYEGEVLGEYGFGAAQIRRIGKDESGKLWFFVGLEDESGIDLFTVDRQGKLEKVTNPRLGIGDFRGGGIYALRKIVMMPNHDLAFWYSQSEKFHFKILDPDVGEVFDLQKELDRFWTYGAPKVMEIYFDRDERMWLSTEDGLVSVMLNSSKFKTVLSDSGGRSARGIVKDNQGNLYVNASGGRYIIDDQDKVTIVPGTYALGATKDEEGNLWFSKHDGGRIEKYNPVLKKSSHFESAESKPKQPWSQWVIFSGENRKVWIGHGYGLAYFDTETNRVENFDQYNEWADVDEDYVYHISQGKRGLWVSTALGLYLLDEAAGLIERYSMRETGSKHIPHDEILHHYIDQEGVFWLATKGGGLIRYDIDSGAYEQFTTNDGLSNDVIYAVYEDDFNQLWLPSNNGLMQFDKTTHQVNTYLVGDGIAHNEFNTVSHYQDDDGLLYFGGLKGVTVFDPKDFVDATTVPDIPLRVTTVQTLNSRTGLLSDGTSQLLSQGGIELKPSDKSLVLGFALLNFQNAYQNSYAYRIEGIDADWNNIQDNSLRLNSLPYGNFVLHIKGRGATGQWSKNELSIPINILRPIYKENWFQFLVILILGLAIWTLVRWRIQRFKRDQLRLQTMVAERTQTISEQMGQIEDQASKLRVLDETKSRFFANISHELRTPLTLILGYLGRTLDQKTVALPDKMVADLTLSKDNGRKLLSLTEEILDLSKLESGELKATLKPVDFYAFLSRLIDSYESFLVDKEVMLMFHYELEKELMLNIDESKFDKIINNLLSNASKYTDEGDEIVVRVRPSDEPHDHSSFQSYELTVSDTGRGIHAEDLPHVFDRFYQSRRADAPTEGGTGIGLALASELAKLMSGSLTVESRYGEGSSFKFSFSSEAVAGVLFDKEDKVLTRASKLPTEASVKLVEPSTSQVSDRRILLVEDNTEMREFVKEILSEDFFVLEAKDGVDALKVLERESVDLIVSDLMMPRLDGYGLLQKLREMEAHQDLPMMMLTARSADEDKLKAFDIGIDDYLTKPFLPDELTARLKNLVKNKDARKQESEQKLEPGDDPKLPSFDREFVKQAEEAVNAEIENPHFGIIDMAEALNVSQRNLTRKVKRTTGLSPLQFIRELRLQKARQLLEGQEKETVSEVMRAIGLQSTGYFAKLYFERFGKRPSDYRAYQES